MPKQSQRRMKIRQTTNQQSEDFSVPNSTGTLKAVLMCEPKFLEIVPIDEVSKKWQGQPLQRQQLLYEHQILRQCYEENGVTVHLLSPQKALVNSVFARDFGGIVKEGYILGRFKEAARQGETLAYERKMAELGIPCLGKIETGILEGGDFLYLAEKTVVIGTGPRSNQQGAKEVAQILAPLGYEVLTAPFDPATGYLHLDTFFNLLSPDYALGLASCLPEILQQQLTQRGIKLVTGPAEFVNQFGYNVVSLGQNRVVTLAQNQAINQQLQACGFEVLALPITEIPKAGGGIHCLTFPLSRRPEEAKI